MVAVGIGQRVVGVGQSELSGLGPAAVDEHVFILYFADRRGFEEAEVALLVFRRHHILHHFRAGLHGGHRCGVQFGGVGALEAPVAVDASVVVNKHGGVELQHAVGRVRVLAVPVRHLEGAVGSMAARHESVAPPGLVVGVQVVSLPSVGLHSHRHVGGKEHVGRARRVEGFAASVAVHHENGAVQPPVAQVVHRCRPHHLVASAVVGLQVVVRPVDVDALLPLVVGVFKDVGLAVGNVLPQRQIGVAHGSERLLAGCCRAVAAGCQCGRRAEGGRQQSLCVCFHRCQLWSGGDFR